MSTLYVHHRLEALPRRWQELATSLATEGAAKVGRAGGALYGIWRSQIGRPRDEVQAMTAWPAGTAAKTAHAALAAGARGLHRASSEVLVPTLRPVDATPPARQGNYAFRWFATPEPHWPEFLDLCAAGWPGFESAYDSQVIGLWQATGDRVGHAPDEATGAGTQDGIRSLLLTRRPNLAMWERSKIPEGAAEAAVRDKLSRRYDLCDWTVVSTATLLTAQDRQDTARWT